MAEPIAGQDIVDEDGKVIATVKSVNDDGTITLTYEGATSDTTLTRSAFDQNLSQSGLSLGSAAPAETTEDDPFGLKAAAAALTGFGTQRDVEKRKVLDEISRQVSDGRLTLDEALRVQSQVNSFFSGAGDDPLRSQYFLEQGGLSSLITQIRIDDLGGRSADEEARALKANFESDYFASVIDPIQQTVNQGLFSVDAEVEANRIIRQLYQRQDFYFQQFLDERNRQVAFGAGVRATAEAQALQGSPTSIGDPFDQLATDIANPIAGPSTFIQDNLRTIMVESGLQFGDDGLPAAGQANFWSTVRTAVFNRLQLRAHEAELGSQYDEAAKSIMEAVGGQAFSLRFTDPAKRGLYNRIFNAVARSGPLLRQRFIAQGGGDPLALIAESSNSILGLNIAAARSQGLDIPELSGDFLNDLGAILSLETPEEKKQRAEEQAQADLEQNQRKELQGRVAELAKRRESILFTEEQKQQLREREVELTTGFVGVAGNEEAFQGLLAGTLEQGASGLFEPGEAGNLPPDIRQSIQQRREQQAAEGVGLPAGVTRERAQADLQARIERRIRDETEFVRNAPPGTLVQTSDEIRRNAIAQAQIEQDETFSQLSNQPQPTRGGNRQRGRPATVTSPPRRR